MTLNDLECRIQLKVRFIRTARLTYMYVCCGFQSWPRVTEWTWALAVSQKNVANELWFQSMRFVRMFDGVYCRGGDDTLSLRLRYLEMTFVWPFCIVLQQVRCSVKCMINDHWSLSEPRKTCVADALSLCGSWASCPLWSAFLLKQLTKLQTVKLQNWREYSQRYGFFVPKVFRSWIGGPNPQDPKPSACVCICHWVICDCEWFSRLYQSIEMTNIMSCCNE